MKLFDVKKGLNVKKAKEILNELKEMAINSKTPSIIFTIAEYEIMISYRSIVGFKYHRAIVLTDRWDYSRTTTKHVCRWLSLTPKQVRKALKDKKINLLHIY